MNSLSKYYSSIKSRFPSLKIQDEITRGLIISVLLLVLPYSPLNAQRPDNPVSIAITKDDVMSLGGWPVERRWYGIALQRLHEGGVNRVFIDIAFPSADIIHPESDDFFFRQLEHISGIYILQDDVQKNTRQNIVLGTKHLLPERFVSPFSKGFSIKNGRLEFKKDNSTIADFFLPSHFSPTQIVVDFPSYELHPDFKLQQVLQEQIACKDRDVVLYLDYPGVTSYIVGLDSRVFSTSSLQLWTIQNINVGNYRSYLPFWEYGLIAVLILLPIAFGALNKRLGIWMEIISFVLWGGASLICINMKIQLDDWWLLVLVPIAASLFVQILNRLKMRRIFEHSPLPHTIPSVENKHDAATMKELQHRLEYYEQLSSQIPTVDLEQGFESHGIFCHKDSPVVDILRKADLVAKNDIPVLIRGESGTGKEMLAQFIHQQSNRRDQPIIAVNCGALNDNLIEAELFGYEKGAFTGAFQQKPGRFELANGGTLFLDEVSETSLAFQVKLLRVLQEGIIERVGGTKPIHVSVRIIAATHQDLAKETRKKTFREDLFYRLNGYELVLPPLRERPQDIEYLFKHFLYEIDRHLKYSEPLVEWLRAQSWPGNIRQLKATIQRAVINAQLRKRSFLIPKDFELLETKNESSGSAEQLAEQILQKLRDYEFHHRSISAVATDLMIHRSTVTEYLRGWIIKYLTAGEWNQETTLMSLRGTARISDEEHLRRRVREYSEYIESRILDGLRRLQTNEQILSTQFRNIPVVFRNDLLVLIQKKRLMIENGRKE